MLLHAAHGGHGLSSANSIRSRVRSRESRPFERTMFFTDRSLYRPGQTIQYKGICFAVNQQQDNYKTCPGRSLTVIFPDVNGKEIERAKHRTNDYGSFSGSVTAPRDRLMGRMTLRVDGDRTARRGLPSRNTSVPNSRYRWTRRKKPRGSATKSSCRAKPRVYGSRHRRRQSALASRPTGTLSHLVVLALLVDAAATGASQEIAHGSAGSDRGRRIVLRFEFAAKPDLSVAVKRASRRSSSPYPRRRDGHRRARPELGPARASTWATRRCRASLAAADWQTD